MSADTILVTGASGFVGSSILASCAETRPMVGLVRPGSERARAAARDNIAYRTLDVWSESALLRALEGVGTVIHCASVVHRPDADEAEYARFNVEGTRMLVSACAASGVGRLVFVSTIKVYGEEPGAAVLDESSAVVGDSPYARTKIEAERLVLEAAAQGLSTAVLRLCPVFGRGDKSNVRTMIRAIAKRRFVVPGSGQNRKSIVHISSVNEAAGAAADSTRTGIFVVADTEAPTMRHLADTIARAVDAPRPPSLPASLVHAMASVAERVAGAVGRASPVTREQLRKFAESTVCSPARACNELGVACHVDLASAIADEVCWLRDSGQLS